MSPALNERDPAETWERRWAKGGLTWLGRRMLRAKARGLREALSGMEPGSMIEIGCGLGHTGLVFREAGFEYFGIDISPTAVSVSRSRGLRVERTDLRDVTGAFDLVASDGLLEHALDFEPLARDMMRISRRRVLLIQPNHGSLPGSLLAKLSEIFRGRTNVREYDHSIEDFVRVFAAGGYILVRSDPLFADVFRLLLFERRPDGGGGRARGCTCSR
jgi:SAM-dependent methyltransferase